jgi:hypothetical protein
MENKAESGKARKRNLRHSMDLWGGPAVDQFCAPHRLKPGLQTCAKSDGLESRLQPVGRGASQNARSVTDPIPGQKTETHRSTGNQKLPLILLSGHAAMEPDCEDFHQKKSATHRRG